ncbi:hypothetical protein GWI33_002958 [Rhynchophorus ferrugineus]|uniref:Rieske domain-containing protein n=1 Tax=Rhynchophorus ferrugineus TaxID=354439 RepID=A0A834IET4_RHYFE|nr:hypothetical protein GWI33_002958 [Rhynchophorus ferrugineus]
MDMTFSNWIPVIPSLLIENGEVEQFIIQGRDVAVWRSEKGHVQIWENRCPHRSVRLSLGQVHGESLVCAYHGWQFAAEDGHCQRIPAQPEQRAPKSLCAKTYPVMEYLGMIWFAEEGIPHFDVLQQCPKDFFYAGSVTIQTTIEQVKNYLLKHGLNAIFEQDNELLWRGALDEHSLQIFITPTDDATTTIHAILLNNRNVLSIHTWLKDMRKALEQEKMFPQECINHV